MKGFIASIITGVVMIAMGATMLFFELQDYDTVQACNLIYDREKTVKSFDISKENLQIIFDEHNVSYEWEYDDSLNGEVKVEIGSNIDYRVTSNRLVIDDTHYESVKTFDIIEKVMDGLKEKKLYQCNGNVSIKIICAKANRDQIQIKYD